ADDKSQPGSVRSGSRTGGGDPANVPVQPTCRSIGRHRRPPPLHYRGADRSGRPGRPVRSVGVVRLGPAEPAAVFLFLWGIAAILAAPAWQAIVPDLVPKEDLSAASALNGVGFNISRAVGPALAGPAIAAVGMAAPFWLNALSTLAVIAALTWWRGAAPTAQSLPAEHFRNAIRSGLRYARYNPQLRATLIRSAGFFPF